MSGQSRLALHDQGAPPQAVYAVFRDALGGTGCLRWLQSLLFEGCGLPSLPQAAADWKGYKKRIEHLWSKP